MNGSGTTLSRPKDCMDVQVTEINGTSATDICNINLTTDGIANSCRESSIVLLLLLVGVPGLKFDKWIGPSVKMSLPSLSGLTDCNPNLLKYSCNIECRIRAVQPARVSGPYPAAKHHKEEYMGHQSFETKGSAGGGFLDNERNLSISVMLSKPILALEFSCLKMQVEAPVVVSH